MGLWCRYEIRGALSVDTFVRIEEVICRKRYLSVDVDDEKM